MPTGRAFQAFGAAIANALSKTQVLLAAKLYPVTRVYYGLGQFIPRVCYGIGQFIPRQTKLYTQDIITISIVLSNILKNIVSRRNLFLKQRFFTIMLYITYMLYIIRFQTVMTG